MILLIEDSPADAEAVQRSFKKAGNTEEILHFQTGDDALVHLHSLVKADDVQNSPLPRLIILDLNLPGLDGRVVLRKLKGSPELKAIPVLVLSSSTSAADIQRVYAGGANAFLRKPVSFESLTEMVHYTRHYWFDVAVMPKNNP